jgi:hypothetical protein
MPAHRAENSPADLINGLTRAERRLTGAIGGFKGWANTEDRDARIKRTHEASPSHVAWHARRRGWDPDRLTEDQLRRAEADKKAYYAQLAFKSAVARRRRKGGEQRSGGAA